MVDFKSLIKEPAFYFKIIECVLCIVGTIFMNDVTSGNIHTFMTLCVAAPNSIITTAVLMILIIVEAQNHITELCLNGASSILNIVVGILLLIDTGRYETGTGHILVAITTIACGIVMIIDCVREFKAK